MIVVAIIIGILTCSFLSQNLNAPPKTALRCSGTFVGNSSGTSTPEISTKTIYYPVPGIRVPTIFHPPTTTTNKTLSNADIERIMAELSNNKRTKILEPLLNKTRTSLQNGTHLIWHKQTNECIDSTFEIFDETTNQTTYWVTPSIQCDRNETRLWQFVGRSFQVK